MAFKKQAVRVCMFSFCRYRTQAAFWQLIYQGFNDPSQKPSSRIEPEICFYCNRWWHNLTNNYDLSFTQSLLGLEKPTASWSFTNIMFLSQSDMDRWYLFVSCQLPQTITCCSRWAGKEKCCPCFTTKYHPWLRNRLPVCHGACKACEPDMQRSVN